MKVYIFGTGSAMVKFLDFVNKTEFEIIAYVDNDNKKQGKMINNISIISPLNINDSIYDYIIIASEYYEEITLQLNKLGITRNVISIFGDYSIDEYMHIFNKILTCDGKEVVKGYYKIFGTIGYMLTNSNKADIMELNCDVMKKYYKERDNYKIEYNDDETCDNKLCVIYFSSNGIYPQNTISEFEKSIIIGDNYEWFKTRIDNAKKHIFLRDIFKCWYANGINYKYNNIDEVVKFLKKETRDFKTICIGSSAGGYMASLVGALLKSEYVIAFSPQFSIRNLIVKSDANYIELKEIIHKSEITIFYFCPFYNLADQDQYKIIKDEDNVKTFIFESNVHGVPITRIQLNSVINMNYNQLIRLHNEWNGKIINKKEFI